MAKEKGIAAAIQGLWDDLTSNQHRVMIAASFIVAAVMMSGWLASMRLDRKVRAYERQAATAKQDAQAALEKAAEIAREKLTIERKVVELEAKRDGKQTEAATAHLAALDARTEYERVIRQQRTDDPSTEQLCAELAALGYPCG